MTKIIHIKDAPSNFKQNQNFVYIGRPSIYGNPYCLKSENERQFCIESYKEFFNEAIKIQEFKEEIFKLKNKTLVCYCKPRLCHGDIIVEYLEK